MLCLVVSGGTQRSDFNARAGRSTRRLGKTRDDAVGEAFDKVARALGLPLPGGPSLEKAAAIGDDRAYNFTPANLEPSFDFSFSGLKTAAAQAMQKSGGLSKPGMPEADSPVAAIAASFQRAAIRQLRRNVERALVAYPVATLGLCGGVAANGALRTALQGAAQAGGRGVRGAR